jgi:hypothetical protein
MELTISNDKGLFAKIAPRSVITEQGFSWLKAWRAAQANLPAADAKKMDDLIAALGQLPVAKTVTYLSENDMPPGTPLPPSHGTHRPYQWVPCRVWVLVESFVGTSDSQEWEGAATPEGLGWSVLPELVKLKDYQASLFQTLKLANGYFSTYEGANKVIKGHASWTITLVDPVSRLGQSTAHALYNPSSRGYLNDKANYVPIAGARLFESAEAARRTAKSRNLTSSVIVVEIEVAVRAIADPMQQPNLGEFGEVVAFAERRRLTEALDRVEIDELLEKVEKIRNEHPELFEERQAQAVKRRL